MDNDLIAYRRELGPKIMGVMMFLAATVVLGAAVVLGIEGGPWGVVVLDVVVSGIDYWMAYYWLVIYPKGP